MIDILEGLRQRRQFGRIKPKARALLLVLGIWLAEISDGGNTLSTILWQNGRVFMRNLISIIYRPQGEAHYTDRVTALSARTNERILRGAVAGFTPEGCEMSVELCTSVFYCFLSFGLSDVLIICR